MGVGVRSGRLMVPIVVRDKRTVVYKRRWVSYLCFYWLLKHASTPGLEPARHFLEEARAFGVGSARVQAYMQVSRQQ